MNRICLLAFVIIIIGFDSCKQKEPALSLRGEYVRTDDPNRLAYWLPEKDSVNHEYCLVAERLWMFGRDNDSVDVFDYNYQMQWHERCEQTLVHCFDSIYPQSSLSSYEKSDSMVNVIFRFFDEDADDTTMGMVVNFDLLNCFLSYKIASLSKEIMKYDKTIEKEILKWNWLHQKMYDFCCGIVNLDWFGGSGAGPVSIATRNSICYDRIADLQNILNYYKDGSVPSSWSIESSLYDFKKTLKETSEKAASTADMKEMDMFADKEREAAYDGIYHQMLDAKSQLSDSINSWVGLRKVLLVPNGSIRKKSSESITSDLLERMAKTIRCSSTDE